MTVMDMAVAIVCFGGSCALYISTAASLCKRQPPITKQLDAVAVCASHFIPSCLAVWCIHATLANMHAAILYKLLSC
jgi:hypothetical protein